MLILGINAYHGDAAAAIVRDGELIAAAEEERFNRVKHCAGFPTQAIQYCLKAAGVSITEVDHIGISRDPSAHLHKKIIAAARRLGKSRVRSQESGVGEKRGVANPEERIAESVASSTWKEVSNLIENRNSQSEDSDSLGTSRFPLPPANGENGTVNGNGN